MAVSLVRKDLHATRVQRKRVIGTIERYPDEAGARSAIAVLLAEINSDKVRMGSRSITVAQLCDHFEQRELAGTTHGAVTRPRRRTRCT